MIRRTASPQAAWDTSPRRLPQPSDRLPANEATPLLWELPASRWHPWRGAGQPIPPYRAHALHEADVMRLMGFVLGGLAAASLVACETGQHLWRDTQHEDHTAATVWLLLALLMPALWPCQVAWLWPRTQRLARQAQSARQCAPFLAPGMGYVTAAAALSGAWLVGGSVSQSDWGVWAAVAADAVRAAWPAWGVMGWYAGHLAVGGLWSRGHRRPEAMGVADVELALWAQMPPSTSWGQQASAGLYCPAGAFQLSVRHRYLEPADALDPDHAASHA